MSRLIVQFAKAPLEGFVKTRMQPYLSLADARSLHESLVLRSSKQLVASGIAEVQLWVDTEPEDPLFLRCLELGVSRVKIQCGFDLGQRMFDCFSKTLSVYESVVLVGSDCPAIDADYLEQAFSALDSFPLVFGPAFDGGYVLLGAREIAVELFQQIAWGQDSVLKESLGKAKRLGLDVAILETKRDLDRPEDLEYYSNLNLIHH